MARKRAEAPENPESALIGKRNPWLYSAMNPLGPESVTEAWKHQDDVLRKWHTRWETVADEMNWTGISKEARAAFERERDLQAYAVWHVWRELRVYWSKIGIWDGDPFDPKSIGEWHPEKIRLVIP